MPVLRLTRGRASAPARLFQFGAWHRDPASSLISMCSIVGASNLTHTNVVRTSAVVRAGAPQAGLSVVGW